MIIMLQLSTCNEMWKTKCLSISNFSVALLLPCGSRTHAAECKKQNFFRFPISMLYCCSQCGKRNVFQFPILVLYCCSLCDSRAHASEHMAYFCRIQNFWFHSFPFPVLVLQIWSPCGSKAHAMECENRIFFQFFISMLHCCSPWSNRARVAKHVASPCGNRNFQFHGFQFQILVSQIWSSCSSRAHAAECRNQIFFQFLILVLHYCLHAAAEHM